MSEAWEAQELRLARKAQGERGGAGEFADRIGEGVGEPAFSEIEVDLGESAEERRLDELAEVFARRVPRALAMRLAEDMMGCEKASAARAAGDGGNLELREKMDAMLVEVQGASHPKMEVRITRMALGWADPDIEGIRKCAAAYNLTPAQVSNQVAAKQRKHGLPRNQFNKSEEMVATYQETNGK